jgi:hypothetical protein
MQRVHRLLTRDERIASVSCEHLRAWRAWVASKKVVLKCTRNVLHCTNSSYRANFWNRDVDAARNILELLSARLLGFDRIPAFAR